MRLITIPMSHYCEKARWALDLANLKWQEEAHLQGFHYLALRGLKVGGMVPVLVTKQGPIADSTRILKYVDEQLQEDARLYPDEHRDEIEALEEDFDEHLGVETRRWVYYHWQNEPLGNIIKLAGQRAPKWERLVAPAVIPFVLVMIANKLAVKKEPMEAGMKTVDQTFDRIAQQTNDGKEFLVGERFTAADLSFACMAAPVLMPPEYGIHLPGSSEIPAQAQPDFDRYRAHPAGRFALRMFSEFRNRSLARKSSDPG